MKRGVYLLLSVVALLTGGCDNAGDFFWSGAWLGLLSMVVGLAIIIYLVTRRREKR